jgi:hypothetical protein
VGSCEHGNEPSGSAKCWEILELLSDWWLLKKHLAPWCLLVNNQLVSNMWGAFVREGARDILGKFLW